MKLQTIAVKMLQEEDNMAELVVSRGHGMEMPEAQGRGVEGDKGREENRVCGRLPRFARAGWGSKAVDWLTRNQPMD